MNAAQEQGPKLPEPMSEERLAELKQLDLEAMSGPWQWFGNTDTHEVFLGTTHSGRVFLMGFKRWGFKDAKPILRNVGDGFDMVDFEAYAEFERAYRRDFQGLDHPDARMMAQGRQGFHELLQEIYRLRWERDHHYDAVSPVLPITAEHTERWRKLDNWTAVSASAALPLNWAADQLNLPVQDTNIF